MSRLGTCGFVDAILDLACSKYNAGSRPLLMYGHSLGGGVAIHLASQPKANDLLSGVILENTFTRIKDVVHAIYPKYVEIRHQRTYFFLNLSHPSMCLRR